MVEVQEKRVGSVGTATVCCLPPVATLTGSVPNVPPQLLPTAMVRAASTFDLGSLLLIVALPSLFWCGVIAVVASLSSYDIATAPLAVVGAVLASFLAIIRASLMIDRSI
jgi:hypothetical protein